MTQEIQTKLIDMIKRGATKKALLEAAGKTMTTSEAKILVDGLLKKNKPMLKDTANWLHKAVVYQLKKGRSIRDLLKNGIDGKYGKLDLADYGATLYSLRHEFGKYQSKDYEGLVVDVVINASTVDGLYTEEDLLLEAQKYKTVDINKVRKRLHNRGYRQLVPKDKCVTPQYLTDEVMTEILYRVYVDDPKSLQRVMGRTMALLNSGNMDLLDMWKTQDEDLFHKSRNHHNMTKMGDDEVLGTLNIPKNALESAINSIKYEFELEEIIKQKDKDD